MRASRFVLLAGLSLFALAVAAGSPPAAAADKQGKCAEVSYPTNPWCPSEKALAPGPGNDAGGDSGGGGGDDDDDDDNGDDDDDDDNGDDDDDDDDTGAGDDDSGGDDDDSGG